MPSPSAIEAPDGNLLDRITSLASEASTASDLVRPGMVGALHALMERLPTESRDEETATRLQRLLEDGHLDGLRDEDGQPSTVVATRTLLDLEHPRALGMAPERLESLRRWERRPLPVPWPKLAVTLFFVSLLHVIAVTAGSEPKRFLPVPLDPVGDADMPATEVEFWFRVVGGFFVAVGMVLANALGWLTAFAVRQHVQGRTWVRRGFFTVGALGLLLGGLHFAVGAVFDGVGAFASAAWALSAGWLSRSPRR